MLDDSWLIDIVDSEWRNDKLPSEDIQVPIESSIDPENGENEGNSSKDQVGVIFFLSSTVTERMLSLFVGKQMAGSGCDESSH